MDYVLSWTGSGARAVREAISSRIWSASVREVQFTDFSELPHDSNSVQTRNTVFESQLEQQKQKIQLTGLATMTSPQPVIEYSRLWLARRYLLLTHSKCQTGKEGLTCCTSNVCSSV
ncbi:oxidation resistance protein 1a isoform X5 [Tachysurus ichikawai]